MPGKESHVRLFDLIMSLSTASDLVSPAVANHGKRVAYIALCIATELGLPLQERYDLLLAGALHDIGALALQERMDLLQFEAEDTGNHAELGYLFLSRSHLLSSVALIVRYHHQHWNDGAGAQVDGITVPPASHILHLADRIDVAVLKHVHPLSQVGIAVRKIASGRNTMFAPDLVDAFERLATREYFWLDIVSPTIDRVLDKSMIGAHINLNEDELVDLAQTFSHIVDFKSPFTSTHSAGVAASAVSLATLAGFSQSELKQMRIAGYLHDLGKLAVPAEILEKPEALSTAEYDVIRSHTYYTRRILEAMPELELIIEWAASHHERLDGGGYPYHHGSTDLPLGARIVAVADVFTALAEDRPYRAGMTHDETLGILDRMVAEGKLDQMLVDLLRRNYDTVNSQRIETQGLAAKEYSGVVEALAQGKQASQV
jgi:HD-GYP domain-containing protein (c-di-GMP phosphodiesterase class II)